MLNRMGIGLIAIAMLGIAVFVTNFTKNSHSLSSPAVAQTTDIPWPMAGGNAQRTGWVNSDIANPGALTTVWVKPIEPFVSNHVQVVGAEGKVFVSTAAGLYAFDANTGAEIWKYATALPLGHSPTYDAGNLYVGGMDRKIHKVSANNGQGVWTFSGEGGFFTSPIIVNGKVIAASRDGALYGINASTGQQAWPKFQTGNQINLSPAAKDGVVYFASNDGYAYAVNADTGAQVWQSKNVNGEPMKLPSMGQYSWWPVIYSDTTANKEYVIFTRTTFENASETSWLFCPVGSTGCTVSANKLFGKKCSSIESATETVCTDLTPNYFQNNELVVDIRNNPNGQTLPDYYEAYPHRRNAFFFDATTGREKAFDLDRDSIPDGAPVSWQGDAGTRPPPVVVDNVLYFPSANRSMGTSFSRGSVMGWKVDTPFISVPTNGGWPSDEPTAISGAGNDIYWYRMDRTLAAYSTSTPNTTFPTANNTREWTLFDTQGGLSYYSDWPVNHSNFPVSATGHSFKEAVKFFWDPQPRTSSQPECCPAIFYSENDRVGPAIYQGKVFVIWNNSLVALAQPNAGQTNVGKNAPVLNSALSTTGGSSSSLSEQFLRDRLAQEVSEMVTAGHLMPSFMYPGLLNSNARWILDDYMHIYWHNPSDVQQILLRALPHLNHPNYPNLQNQVRSYLQDELTRFSPAIYAHTGFAYDHDNNSQTPMVPNGTQRDPYPYPPYHDRTFPWVQFAPRTGSNFSGWGLPPHNFYALWKMAENRIGCTTTSCTSATQAQVFLNAINDSVPNNRKLKTPITANNAILTNEYLRAFPHSHNAYLAGYKGYIELKRLAGQTLPSSDPYVTEYQRLLDLRVAQLMTFPNPQEPATSICDEECYFETVITAYNFMYLTPELADYLATNATITDPDGTCSINDRFMNGCRNILSIIQKYQQIAPYWMVAHNGETQGENSIMPYQQTHSLFQALAQVKGATRQELLKYLDTPIVPVGDLYYIDNLVAVLEADDATGSTKPGDANSDGSVNGVDYSIWFSHYGQTVTNTFGDGDFNADGRVDGLDYVIWLRNYGM